jgi:hypothetical protein
MADQKKAKELQEELDEALEATFPASDPVAVDEASSAKPDRPVDRKPAALDVALVEELARNVGKKHEG